MKKFACTFIALLLSGSAAFTKTINPVDRSTSLGGIVPPYTAMVQVLHVSDYSKWLRALDANAGGWHTVGLTEPSFARAMDDTNRLTVFYTVLNVARARAFLKSGDEKKLMGIAGVTEVEQTSFINVLYDLNSIMQQERLFVTQHVKNYKGWKKAFDANRQTRINSGLVDRLIARDSDDPNKVIVYFGVKDVGKAKAYAVSADFGIFCSDAGIAGQPEIVWYTWINYKGWYYDNTGNN